MSYAENRKQVYIKKIFYHHVMGIKLMANFLNKIPRNIFHHLLYLFGFNKIHPRPSLDQLLIKTSRGAAASTLWYMTTLSHYAKQQ